MDKEISVGIIGCGGIAQAHLNGYQNTDGVTISGVMDISQKARERAADETGAEPYDTIEGLLENEDLDCVSICTPPAVHLENCVPCLEAGIPVLCEKPLETDRGRAVELARTVQDTGTMFMTAFCHRFHPPVIELNKILDSDELGDPVMFRNFFGGWLNLKGNHRADPTLSGGGCLMDHTVHAMDLFRFLMGEVGAVQAQTANVVQDLKVEDFGMVQVETHDNMFGQIASTYSLPAGRNTIEIDCTEGGAVITYFEDGVPDLVVRKRGESAWNPVDCSAHPDRFEGEIRHFVACVRAQKAPSVTVEDGLKGVFITEAVYESEHTGCLTEVHGAE